MSFIDNMYKLHNFSFVQFREPVYLTHIDMFTRTEFSQSKKLVK